MQDSVYRCGETAVYRTVCTGVGETAVCRTVCTVLYVGQCVQVWGNCCMQDNVYRCAETAVYRTVCTGVGKLLYVGQFVRCCL